MDKKKLRQYKALQKEIPDLKKKLDKLYARSLNIPTVLGKVTGSGENFPYIEERITVQMDEPKEAEQLNKQIRINEERLRKAESDKTEIEEFISGINDSMDRQIFEISYIEGKKQREVAKELGYTEGRISQKISQYLKD